MLPLGIRQSDLVNCLVLIRNAVRANEPDRCAISGKFRQEPIFGVRIGAAENEEMRNPASEIGVLLDVAGQPKCSLESREVLKNG
jgi:hypothetical protein